MSTNTTSTTAAMEAPMTDVLADPAPATRPVWKAGLVAGAIAAVVNVAVVAIARAGDVSVAVQRQRIPLLGFAQLTIVGALLGIGLGKLVSRRAAAPRRAFVRLTVALVALSVVPDVLADAALSTKLVLMLTHLVAAAIIVPTIAVRLAPRR